MLTSNGTKQKNKAFTLVETLVAISIFTTSIVVLMVLLGQGIANTNYAKNKMIAAYLAQEGIEYLRNLQDTYALYSSSPAVGWTDFNNQLTAASCQGANGCYFDDSDISFADLTVPIEDIDFYACGANCPALKYDITTGKYGYVAGADSGFRRKIRVEQTTASETKVYSTVFWTQGSGTYSSVFSESLFNWVE